MISSLMNSSTEKCPIMFQNDMTIHEFVMFPWMKRLKRSGQGICHRYVNWVSYPAQWVENGEIEWGRMGLYCLACVGVLCVLVCYVCWCVVCIGVLCVLVCYMCWCVVCWCVMCGVVCCVLMCYVNTQSRLSQMTVRSDLSQMTVRSDLSQMTVRSDLSQMTVRSDLSQMTDTTGHDLVCLYQ